jgi:hypothetical protein
MDQLDDDQLAARAYAWRRLSMHGRPGARSVAIRMERELQRRLGVPTTLRDTLAAPDDRTLRRRWWRFWEQ